MRSHQIWNSKNFESHSIITKWPIPSYMGKSVHKQACGSCSPHGGASSHSISGFPFCQFCPCCWVSQAEDGWWWEVVEGQGLNQVQAQPLLALKRSPSSLFITTRLSFSLKTHGQALASRKKSFINTGISRLSWGDGNNMRVVLTRKHTQTLFKFNIYVVYSGRVRVTGEDL